MISGTGGQQTGRLAQCLEQMQRAKSLRSELLMNNDSKSEVLYAKPLLDAVQMFETLGIGYALIGGLAGMVYGTARFTEDVEFFAVAGHQEALGAHAEVMRDCGFDPLCTSKLCHRSGKDVGVRRDKHSDVIVARARMIKLAGRPVQVIEPHDLIAMKLQAGSMGDDYDISEILFGREAIDDEVVRARVSAGEFERYLQIKGRAKAERP